MSMSKESAEWLDGKYQKWKAGVRRAPDEKGRMRLRDSLKEFAKYVGVSRSTMNNWLLKQQTPDPRSADKIAAVLGDEIYDFVEPTQNDPLFKEFRLLWGKLDYGQKVAIIEEARRFAGFGSTRGGERVLAEAQLS